MSENEQLQELEELEELLRAVPMVHPPLGFAGRVMARIDRRRQRRRATLGGLMLATGAALSIVLLLLPEIWALPGWVGSWLAFWPTGEIVLARVADAAVTVLNSFFLTAGVLIVPLGSLALCSLFMALVSSVLWVGLVQRWQPTAIQLIRR
ncbi:MAG: hypothetical protein JW900_09935 [Anaerolineae bacterium]|nr:hypothetical protein [Anaerolineae bacterium]